MNFCQRSVQDVENASSSATQQNLVDSQLAPKLKILTERATLLKITSNAMLNACAQFMELTQTQVIFFKHLIIKL